MRDRLDAAEVSRRRFARRQWARRWGTWRGLLVVAGVIGVVVLAFWIVLVSSVLDVRGVQVTGNELLKRDAIRSAAAVPKGEPLARADLDAIRARVEAMRAVKAADVTRAWPHDVRIEVTERVAVAVIDEGERLRGMDAEGVVFRTYARRPADLPLIRTAHDTRADAMTEAAALVGVLPAEVAKRVASVDVKTRDAITLTLRDGRRVRWGSAEQAPDKAKVLKALLKARPSARVYDVSVPGQPTVR